MSGAYDDFGGLVRDVSNLIDRRRALGLLGGLGVAVVAAACGSESDADTSANTPTTPSGSGDVSVTGSCTPIPQETAGPYPGDGTNGPNVLSESGVVRKDIRASVGDATGLADGVPLTIRFRLTDSANGCEPVANAAVYAWHCTRDGAYSMYSAGLEGENFLRGVQVADANGIVEFTSIFPGCYSGRWPHIHFEVYPTVDAATTQTGHVAVSQIALPKDACDVVYATTGYESSVANLSTLSLSTDNVFSDDSAATQLGTITGDVAAMTVELAVGVDTAATPSMGGASSAPGGPPPNP